MLTVSAGQEVLHRQHLSWETEEDFRARRDGAGMAAHSGERAKPVATGSNLLEFEVVSSVDPRA
jgi:heme-degrading monooxygenase HmoA